MKYQPDERDREFAREMCQVVKDGKFWVLPSTGLIYKFDKVNRTMTLLNRDRLADMDAMQCHMQTQAVFATNNYEVL